MPRYQVEVRRSTTETYELEAESPADADSRWGEGALVLSSVAEDGPRVVRPVPPPELGFVVEGD